MNTTSLLTNNQIETFQRDGVLVVDNFLSSSEIQDALLGLEQTLQEYGVDVHDLEGTGNMLRHLSSTNGSGGILDLFYPSFKMKIATNEQLFQMTTELWKSAYYHNGEIPDHSISQDDFYKYHPFGAFDCNKGYCYIDRIGYRLPTSLAEEIGCQVHHDEITEIDSKCTQSIADKNSHLTTSITSATTCTTTTTPISYKNKKQKKKNMAIQRSLTPHFDCCPETFLTTNNKSKWRPIQCFVSLTDNTEPSTGGFEAYPGFHRNFHQWAQERPSSTYKKKNGGSIEVPAPCIGEYTHVRPKEDQHVMDGVRHIPVRAGSVVFWDNRIPHANTYRNNGDCSRAVIYCSFLPDVELNRVYVQNQLEDWYHKRIPRDMWINVDDEHRIERSSHDNGNDLSIIGKKLMGIDAW